MARHRQRTLILPGEMPFTAMASAGFLMFLCWVLGVSLPPPPAQITQLRVMMAGRPERDSMLVRAEVFQLRIGADDACIAFDRQLTMDELENVVEYFAVTDRDTPTLVTCSRRASHGKLLDVLQLCDKHHLYNISVGSDE